MIGIYDYSETGQEFVFRHPKEGSALYGQGTLRAISDRLVVRWLSAYRVAGHYTLAAVPMENVTARDHRSDGPVQKGLVHH